MNRIIESSGTGISRILLALVLALVLAAAIPMAVQAKGPPHGGKVRITGLSPAQAEPGDAMDVLIDGAGFDVGSTATFTRTGTSDTSSVSVGTTTFLAGTGQLLASIVVAGDAPAGSYDVAVENSGGRSASASAAFEVLGDEPPPPPPPPPPSPSDEFTLLHSKCCFGEIHVSGDDPGQPIKVWDKSIVNHTQAVWLSDGAQFAFRGSTRLDGETWISGLYRGSPDGSVLETLALSTSEFRISSVDSGLAAASQTCGDGTPALFFIAGEYDPLVPSGTYVEVQSIDPFNPGPPTPVTFIPGYRKHGLDVSPNGELLALWLTDPISGAQSLQIRDLCAEKAPVLWEWTAAEMGFSAQQVMNQLDLSVEGVLVVSMLLSDGPCQAYCEATLWFIDPFSQDVGGLPAMQQLTGPGGLQPGIERGISPAWSPEGRRLMFSSGTQKKTRMYLYDLDADDYSTVANYASLTLDWMPNWSTP